MKQSEHIDMLVKLSKERSFQENKIQRAYQEYVSRNNDEDFEELAILLDAFCVPWVRKKLWITGCYSDENEHTVLQEAKISVWETILKDRIAGSGKDTFAYFAFKIYKNKTWDIVRKVSRRRARIDTCSMEEIIGDDGRTVEDTLQAVDIEKTDEIRQMYDRIFGVYCKGFLTSKAFPPRNLALYYARVLPHLLCEIPDTKGASAKWAFERMGKRTMWELKEDSEKTLQRNVDAGLCWGKEFVIQMNEKFDVGGAFCTLKEVIYTAAYAKGKIEDWAESMHKATVKAVMKLLPENRELLKQVEEYIPQEDVLYHSLKGGKDR